MKKFLLLSASLMFCCAAQAQDRPEFADVDFSHWAYPAMRKAARWIIPQEKLDEISLSRSSNREATRYEFAVAICRMEDELSSLKTPPLYPEIQARDIVAALHREFENEVSRLQVRDSPSNISTRSSGLIPPVVPPPRLILAPPQFNHS